MRLCHEVGGHVVRVRVRVRRKCGYIMRCEVMWLGLGLGLGGIAVILWYEVWGVVLWSYSQ